MIPVLSNCCIRSAWSLLAACLVAACSSSDAEPGHELTIQVTVVDSAGDPVANSYLNWSLWPAIDSTWPFPWDTAMTRTDSLGRYVIEAGRRTERPDSLRLYTMPPGCESGGVNTFIRTFPATSVAHDTLGVTVAVPVSQSARLQTGQVCAFDFDPFWGDANRFLALQIDSIVPPLAYGRFRINYRWTRGDDEGTFVGVDAGSYIVFDLTTTVPTAGCDTAKLYVPVRADGTWETVQALGSQGCFGPPVLLNFASGDFLYFP